MSAKFVLFVCVIVSSLLCGCIDTADDISEISDSVPVFSSIDAATEKLPLKHERFDIVKRNFYDSQISDFTSLGESMWKRPEFYPTWERSGIKNYEEHDYTRWTVYGYGFFPGVQSWTARNMTAGDNITYHTYLHSSWGVETWQGMKLVPIYDESLFDVTITPNEFYLEPTYPVFYEDWTHMLELTVTSKTAVPAGTYTISVDIVEPDADKTEEWSWEILDKFSDGKYKEQIELCKSNSDLTECEELLKMRQNKYVTGNMFQPDNGFVSYIVVV